MREPERIDRIMTLIHKVWEKYPDTRFMQLVESLKSEYSQANGNCLKREVYEKEETRYLTAYRQDTYLDSFNLEDTTFEKFLIKYWEEINK